MSSCAIDDAPRIHDVPLRCATICAGSNVSVLTIQFLAPRLLAVLVRLLAGLLERFAGHVARVEMVLSRRLLARLLLFWILVVGHGDAPVSPLLTASGRGRFPPGHSC